MTVVLALGCAVMYGLSDFVGGLLSRRTSVWPVAVVAQVASTALTGTAALLLPGQATPADWAWGALAGVGAGAGTAFLYRGLATGRMGVVAPLSAVGSALLPVVVGLVTGERPALWTWIGIGCALPAIWLVSRAADSVELGGSGHRVGEGVVDGLLAGMGFGVLFAALGQVRDSAGLGPLALTQLASIVVVIALAAALRQPWVPRDRVAWRAVGVGALGAAATVLFLFASQSGLLTVASVLSSLYPAFTVLLAATVLREHIHRTQAVGLALAAAAVSLVAVG
ncbi:MAG TPA: DMT family transporter [Nocardioidaceae bacterium]|nr:DMT family transporter [Nocardioidaceae bacterium]